MRERIGSDLIGPAQASLFRTDDEIKNDVLELIEVNDVIESKGVDVAVSNGIVTLSGRVNNSDAWDEAANAARTVLGVTDVINRLEID